MNPNINFNSEKLQDMALNCVLTLTDEAKQFLHSKGVSDELIKKFSIGLGRFYEETWITIPVYDVDEKVRYIRLLHYSEDANDSKSQWSTIFPHAVEPTIFNESSLSGENECMIVGSELDAIVAGQYLEMPVITLPIRDTFKPEQLECLMDKETIYVWPDEGKEAGSQSQSNILDELVSYCQDATIMELNLPKGINGATEYFTLGGTIRELFDDMRLIAGEPPLKAEEIEEMSLDELADVLDTTIKNDREVKKILFLAMLLMYTEADQINVCLLGQSSSGKTYTAQEVAKYFPAEDITEYAEVSPTAFKHMSPKVDSETGKEYVDCERRTLMFTEMPHPGLLANLRPILSHDKKEVEFLTTDRGKTGGNVAKRTIIRGFPTVIFCSAYTRLNEQEVTRCLLLSPEVSDEKLEASVMLTGERVANPEAYKHKLETNNSRQELRRRVKYIKDLHINSVIIKDYRKVLSKFRELNPRLAPRSQRDIAHLSSLIKAVAMLNAPYRMNENNDIIANDEDIENGLSLWKSICKTQMLGLPPATYDFYKKYILPAYEKAKEARKNEPLPHDDGVTHDEINQYYYEQTGSFFSRDTLRKQIIPTLQAANVISLEKSIKDGRKWLIKPLIFSL